MNCTELSQAFDAYLNSWALTQYGTVNGSTLALNEYEKSLYLTEAQRNLVIEIYKGDTDASFGVDKTALSKVYLKGLINNGYLSEATLVDTVMYFNKYQITLPEDCFVLLNETVNLNDDLSRIASVVPVAYDSINKMFKNPYRRPSHSTVFRTLENDSIYYYSTESITEAHVNYIKTIPPIIVAPLLDGITIEGNTEETPPVLPAELHTIILKKAIELAYTYMATRSNVESNTD